MKNFKIMSMLLGGLLVLGSLTACGGGYDSTDPPTPPHAPCTLRESADQPEGRLYSYCVAASARRGYGHRALYR